jgi:hypothetical protein
LKREKSRKTGKKRHHQGIRLLSKSAFFSSAGEFQVFTSETDFKTGGQDVRESQEAPSLVNSAGFRFSDSFAGSGG